MTIEPYENERVSENGNIYVDTWRFECVFCGSVALRRTCGRTRKIFSSKSMRFRCTSCNKKSKRVVDKKNKELIDIEKYLEILNNV